MVVGAYMEIGVYVQWLVGMELNLELDFVTTQIQHMVGKIVLEMLLKQDIVITSHVLVSEVDTNP